LHHAGAPRLTFSGTELLHLLVGVVAITYCFTIVGSKDPFPLKLAPDPTLLLAAFVAVATGFVLHELAHKVVAQRYGHWAEFRADFRYLAVSVLMAIALPLFVAVPGAVWIQGRIERRQYGIISLVGPATNVTVCLVAVATDAVLRLADPSYAINVQGGSRDGLFLVIGMTAVANGLLAVFNLLPFPFPFVASLDGRRVWRWSKPVWTLSFVLALGLFVWVLLRIGLSLFPQ